MKLIDILRAALVGKSIKHTNQYGRLVTLRVEDVVAKHHSVTVEGQATPQNDWWPDSTTHSWDEIIIKFDDGSSITQDWNGEFEIVYPRGGQFLG